MRSGRSGEAIRVWSTPTLAPKVCVWLLAGLWTGAGWSQGALQSLGDLSLQDLGKIVVTSVAKKPEPLADAPAAVYVITHEEIVRSGATTLPEILRLAPNLGVFQLTPSNYIITSRGLSGSQAAQNFPNKLLVLIDGRSVYNPLFSGIYWDEQYVLPENIDRIEVISGPAGALWGANAVNGVINIITRHAADTQGGLLEFGFGNHEVNGSIQYGGKLGNSVWYRVYAHDFRQRSFDDSAGRDAHDSWAAPQAGFRVDWDVGGANSVTFDGNAMESRAGQGAGAPDVHANGANLLARWRHESEDGSTFRLQAYYDRGHSGASLSSGGGTIITWDIEAQQDFAFGDRQHITWGIGDRVYHYRLVPSIRSDASLLWDPASGTQNLANVFAQDQIALGERTQVTVGLKAEDDPYSGLSWMPSAKLSWKSSGGTLLWASVARSVRTPTVFDTSVIEVANLPSGPVDFLRGNPDYRTEKLTAYEAGLRTQWDTRATLSVSLYYNDYNDLRSIETSPAFLPLYWGNGMQGHAHGADLWAGYSVADWWKLSAGLSLEHEYFRFKPWSSGLLGTAIAGNDPKHRAFLRSSMNLGDHWNLDGDLREIGALPDPHVPGYVELDARLAWAPNGQWELALAGMNLLHPWHQEYVLGQSDRIGRTVFLDARMKF